MLEPKKRLPMTRFKNFLNSLKSIYATLKRKMLHKKAHVVPFVVVL